MEALQNKQRPTASPGSDALAPPEGQVSCREIVSRYPGRILERPYALESILGELGKHKMDTACLSGLRISECGHLVIKALNERVNY